MTRFDLFVLWLIGWRWYDGIDGNGVRYRAFRRGRAYFHVGLDSARAGSGFKRVKP